MNKPMRLNNNMIKIINNSLNDLPTPTNITILWNFGSLLGICLMTQILSGIFLAMHYSNSIETAFSSVIHICREVNYGWVMRNIHANGASMFFICLYMHTGRGIYFSSFKFKSTWLIGVIILILTMATAFLGYVLPWGQMSFWGATVITNLLSAIPYLGEYLVQWLWGGFSVNNATLTRFFTIHFLLPFIISALVLLHLMSLHNTGSSNPLGVNANIDKVPFNPYFSLKDFVGFIFILLTLNLLIIMSPNLLGDPDNFIPANPMNTPPHIKPEWYFLFAYAILRSIPNKLGGVIALLLSILVLMILPFYQMSSFKGLNFYPINQIMFWMFISNLIMLTWIGASPVETPYILMGKIMTILYFNYFIWNPLMTNFWDKIIF